MDGISTSAASGMRARMESLEMLANNLANVETGSFKADREFFSIYTGEDATADPLTGDTPVQPLIESHWTDISQGNLLNTSNRSTSQSMEMGCSRSRRRLASGIRETGVSEWGLTEH